MTPIHKTTVVPLPPAAAFDLFLRRIDHWWPKDRHGADACAEIKVDPQPGGRIIEVAPDGTETLWGRIRTWDPDRFVAFTWFPDGDEDNAPVIAVSFHPAPDGTRVELTICPADQLGTPVDAVSTSYLFGWDLVLGSYAFVARVAAGTPTESKAASA